MFSRFKKIFLKNHIDKFERFKNFLYDNEGKLKNIFFVSIIINLILFILFFLFITPRFETNDDVAMMRIASGALTGSPSEYLVFINVILGKVLKVLYINFPNVYWYTMLFYCTHFIAMIVLLYSLMYKKKNIYSIILFLFLFVFLELYTLTNLQFTTTAFVVGMSGVFLFVTNIYEKDKKFWIAFLVSILLLLLSSLIRKNSFYLVLGLSCPILGLRFIENRSFKIPLFFIITVSLFFSAYHYDKNYYQKNQDWNHYLEYNKARAKISDYPSFKYDETNKDVYNKAGWNENDTMMFRSWFFSDKNVYSKDKLEYIVSNIKQRREVEEIVDKLWNVIKKLDSKAKWFTICLVTSAIIFVEKKEKKYILMIFFTVCLFSIYLSYLGRLPQRVFLPLIFFLNTTVVFFRNVRVNGIHNKLIAKKNIKEIFIISSVLITMVTFISIADYSKVNITNRESFNETADELMNRDKIYVNWGGNLPLQLISPFSDSKRYNKLNLVSLGWSTHSPHYNENLYKFSIENLYNAIVERDDVFIISSERNISLLSEFMREHYDQFIGHTLIMKNKFITVYKIYNIEPKIKYNLPKESNNIYYSIDNIQDEKTENIIKIEGWGLIKEKKSYNSKIKLVLKSDNKSYVVNTIVKQRKDIKKIFDLDNHNIGFEASMLKDKIDPGEYEIGLYIKEDEVEELQLTNKFITIENDLLKLNNELLIDKTEDIICSLNTCEYLDESKSISVSGWGFLKEQNYGNRITKIVLKSDENNYIFSTKAQKRKDVNLVFKDLKSDDVGFYTDILKDRIADGMYEIGVYIKKDKLPRKIKDKSFIDDIFKNITSENKEFLLSVYSTNNLNGDYILRGYLSKNIESKIWDLFKNIGYVTGSRYTDAIKYTNEFIIKDHNQILIENEFSKLEELSLPIETMNIKYAVDKMEKIGSIISIEGWSYITDQSTKDTKIKIVLKSDLDTYIFDTVSKKRLDVSEYFKTNNLDDSGFKANILNDLIKKGKYKIGIYIEKDDLKALQYTDLILVSNEDFSSLQKINLPEKNDNINFGIDKLEQDNEIVSIEGWSYIKNQESYNSKINIVLKSDTNVYIFDTIKQIRPDVSEYFKSDNLDESGFKAGIAKKLIEEGEYRVGIYIEKDGFESLKYTDITLTIE